MYESFVFKGFGSLLKYSMYFYVNFKDYYILGLFLYESYEE